MKLREITSTDIEFVNQWRNDEEIIDNLGSNFRYINIETDNLWFENYMKSRSRNVILIIEVNDQPIGLVYLKNIDPLNSHAEFAIQIANTSNKGKGYGTLATKKCLEHAFMNLNINRVYLFVLDHNKVALGLYNKIGFKHEGTMRQSIYKNGRYQDLHLMGILKDEYHK